MKELNVYLNFSKTDKIFVGTLAESENNLFFEYAASFLSDPLWLSPYKLPPKPVCLKQERKPDISGSNDLTEKTISDFMFTPSET